MFPKSRSSSDHVGLVHWITQNAPASSSEELLHHTPAFDFDEDFDDEGVEPDEDFDWV